jgi:hypothetical protein
MYRSSGGRTCWLLLTGESGLLVGFGILTDGGGSIAGSWRTPGTTCGAGEPYERVADIQRWCPNGGRTGAQPPVL